MTAIIKTCFNMNQILNLRRFSSQRDDMYIVKCSLVRSTPPGSHINFILFAIDVEPFGFVHFA